ncbi:hypothetical protein [Priestia megaterium]|uniref:hypothetical protein n=1 Tax=Priestia megaterium TaxID=1404 RepID=UPI00300BC679
MNDAIGPILGGGGFESFEINEDGVGYRILYLPDKNNHQLQMEGKPPVYYWVPDSIRLARNGEDGDYKFHHIHFVGDQNQDTHIAAEEVEVAGGLIAFTTTISYPASVLQKAQDQLLERFRGKDDKYWGWNTDATPQFRIVPITDNVTSIQNNESQWKLDGQGPGNITGGENAYSGMLDSSHSHLLWASFHGTYSAIAINQVLQIPVWTEPLYLKITANWEKIFTHFSTQTSYRGWFRSYDIQTEFNKLIINGDINVVMRVDGTNPGNEEMKKLMEQNKELIIKQFTEMASKIIFDPVSPTEAAKTKGGFFGFGSGFALKQQYNKVNVGLSYEETLEYRYNKEHAISSSLEGFYNEIKQDPSNEQKYFTKEYLGDLNLKVSRIVKPVVNWPKPEKDFAGEPVAFLSAQVGYPGKDGTIQWQLKEFNKEDSVVNNTWRPDIPRRTANEVSNPPEGWTPDKTFIKRKIHLLEPPSVSEYPFTRIYVEKNEIDLDPTPNGTLSNDGILEVRTDSAGILDVGPISYQTVLKGEEQVLEVEFQALGTTLDGKERPVVKFVWDYKNRDQTGHWKIYTGQLDFKPLFRYRVHAIIKGDLLNDGMDWYGPWIDGAGDGPIVIKVPKKNEAVPPS